jgi:hypothetical protein
MSEELKLRLPFLFINSSFGYSISSILRKIYASPDFVLKENSFPYEISSYIWVQEGKIGNSSWFALGKLQDGLYFFYRAYAHSDFIKDGHMDLWISPRLSDLQQFAMDRETYDIYSKNNTSAVLASEPSVNQ